MPEGITCEHLPLKSVTMTNETARDPDEDEKHVDELLEVVSDNLCRNSLVMHTDCFSSCLSDLSQTIVEHAGCGGPELVRLPMICGCKAGWMYCQIFGNFFEDGFEY